MLYHVKAYIKFLFLFFIVNAANAQDGGNKYLILTAKADSFFVLKNYQAAADLYGIAFSENHGLSKVGHRYRVASCFAMLNKSDSAFIELDKIANKGKFSGYDMIITDSNFKSIHSDPRWAGIIKLIETNKENKPKMIMDN